LTGKDTGERAFARPAGAAAVTRTAVAFSGCDLREADFRQARCTSVAFSGCDLTGADISGARFEGCSIAGCTLDGLRGVDRLRGVAMPWADIVAAAGVFAGELGVRLLDE
jgi:uncharacterized protein YjbI with pentapeptide repeats